MLAILGLQSISRDPADNVSHPRWLEPIMKLTAYSFVIYLQHDYSMGNEHIEVCMSAHVVLRMLLALS